MIDFVLKFVVTFVFAFLFGIERQRAHKPVGFATYVFVAVGACGLAIASLSYGFEDPVPLLSGIVTGIGFLGAGALIRTTDRIFGFTTAASIWMFAILGVIIGMGQYLAGIALYALVWVAIFFDRYYEMRGIGSYQKKIIVNTNKIVDEGLVASEVSTAAHKAKLIVSEIDKETKQMSLTFLLEGTKEEMNELPKKLYKKEWFSSCKLY